MCYVGQQSSFETGQQLFKRLMNLEINHQQIHRVSDYCGNSLTELEVQKVEKSENMYSSNLSKSTDDINYIMVDGGMVFTREEQWKEIKLGRIFSTSSILNTSKSRNYISDSLYVSHLGSSSAFTEKLDVYVDDLIKKVFIADGAKWIWNWITSNHPNSIQILDFFHAIENLGRFANAQFKQKEERSKWLSIKRQEIKEGKVETLIKELEKMKPKGSKAIDEKNSLIQYFENNKSRMKYDEYIKKGYQIGSGAIEAAHRNIIQQRMKLSGQRWSKKGAQNMANLRICFQNKQEDLLINSIIRKAA